jgi:formylglycine-generating enzyme required for sulfatase activity
MRHHAFSGDVTRQELLDWYRAARERTRALFDLVRPEAYYDRPIALRNPIVFYEGHLPGFSVNTLVKLALKRDGVHARLEALFARGIDPEDEATVRSPTDVWPSRDEVQAFAAACDALVEATIAEAPLEDDDVPQLRGGEAVLTILEHELMHQETLLYMLHNLPYERKSPSRPVVEPPRLSIDDSTTRRLGGSVLIPPGRATLGAVRGSAFGWDNEFPSTTVDVGAFEMGVHSVTNGQYLDYMTATRAAAPHFWERGEHEWYRRGMFESAPLPLDEPVYVTYDEASAYARWKGMRLPSEAEFHRAAYGTPSGEERPHPWGDAAPDATRGQFDFASFGPVAVGSHPAGASAWGVHDLVGNGWEWTSSIFAGFPGFTAMPSYPQYSADFFDNAHYVLKGASPVTASALIRRSFRNWFRPHYPFVFAKFRCVLCK